MIGPARASLPTGTKATPPRYLRKHKKKAPTTEWPGPFSCFRDEVCLVALQVQNPLQDASDQASHTVVVRAVRPTSVVTVLVTTPEAFTEVELVFRKVNPVAVVPISSILIGVAVAIIKSPSVFTVRLAGSNAFLVTKVQSLSKHVRAVLVRQIVSATSI